MNTAPDRRVAESQDTAQDTARRVMARMDMQSPWQAVIIPAPETADGQRDQTVSNLIRGMLYGTGFAFLLWVFIAGIFAITPGHW